MGIIEDTEAEIEALKSRLSSLEGPEHKRERKEVNKAIYALEHDEGYTEAVKTELEAKRNCEKEADLRRATLSLTRLPLPSHTLHRRPIATTFFSFFMRSDQESQTHFLLELLSEVSKVELRDIPVMYIYVYIYI